MIKTEDDVLHVKELPHFNGRISPSQAELLVQYLTVPTHTRRMFLGFVEVHAAGSDDAVR